MEPAKETDLTCLPTFDELNGAGFFSGFESAGELYRRLTDLARLARSMEWMKSNDAEIANDAKEKLRKSQELSAEVLRFVEEAKEKKRVVDLRFEKEIRETKRELQDARAHRAQLQAELVAMKQKEELLKEEMRLERKRRAQLLGAKPVASE